MALSENVEYPSKQEMLEIANFIYSRYEVNKLNLNKAETKEIIKKRTNHDNNNK